MFYGWNLSINIGAYRRISNQAGLGLWTKDDNIHLLQSSLKITYIIDIISFDFNPDFALEPCRCMIYVDFNKL